MASFHNHWFELILFLLFILHYIILYFHPFMQYYEIFVIISFFFPVLLFLYMSSFLPCKRPIFLPFSKNLYKKSCRTRLAKIGHIHFRQGLIQQLDEGDSNEIISILSKCFYIRQTFDRGPASGSFIFSVRSGWNSGDIVRKRLYRRILPATYWQSQPVPES